MWYKFTASSFDRGAFAVQSANPGQVNGFNLPGQHHIPSNEFRDALISLYQSFIGISDFGGECSEVVKGTTVVINRYYAANLYHSMLIM